MQLQINNYDTTANKQIGCSYLSPGALTPEQHHSRQIHIALKSASGHSARSIFQQISEWQRNKHFQLFSFW